MHGESDLKTDAAASAWADLQRRLTGPGSFYSLKQKEGATPSFRFGPKTVFDICARAQTRGSQALVVTDERIFTYREIFERAAALAWRLNALLDLGPGDRVGLAGANGPLWLVGFLGSMLARTSVVLLPDINGLPILRRQLGVQTVIVVDHHTECELRAVMDPADLIVVAAVELASTPDTAAVAKDWGPCPSQEAVVAFTSGTSGRPKPVSLSHGAITAGMMNTMLASTLVTASMVARKNIMTPPVALIGGPLSHVSGYLQILIALLLGSAIGFAPSGEERAIAGFIKKHRVTSVSGFNTDTAMALFARRDARTELKSLRSWNVYGAQSRASLIRLIKDVLPDVHVSASYGLTEINGSISSVDAKLLEASVACVGRVVPTVAVKIVDRDGKAVAPCSQGEIWLMGDMLMRGYVNDDGSLHGISDGWFRSGDFGHLSETGELFVLGRCDEIVELGTGHIALPSIEQFVSSQEGVSEAAALWLPSGECGIAVVFQAGIGVNERRLHAAIADRFGLQDSQLALIAVGELSKTRSGKIMRSNMRELFESRS